MRQMFFGIKISQCSAFGEFIPRANQLTVITSINSIAHERSE